LAALYALGSLTQQEARSFDLHLKEGCSICETELRKFEHAVTGIGLAAEQTAAPAYIRDLLSARIERESQMAPPVVPSNLVEQEKIMREFLRPKPAAPQLWAQPKATKPSIFPWVLVIAMAALGLFAANLWRQAQEKNTQLEAQIAAAQADSEDMQRKLEIGKLKADNLDEIMETVGKPAVRIARLMEQTASTKFSAVVLWDTSEDRCLVLGHFPPAPEGKRYQIWFFTPTVKASAGPISVSPTGQTLVSCPVPREAAGASAAVITVEPDNGSQIPTSPYFAVGRIE
jgi:hypothetical protein